eukprot:gnl/TRDRNA2_/TRDRNA2_172190_c1_seq2.p1 gnl/TRDRNA2_/TRDRNA2_172190_c1~~gnl/TRDRNA2_/TRDRNA2_172190_c1_seq2.p1  ORF type:complete len:359 (+),score=55.18 gnl/TRDRNA2_/TRDRNA2_172190_c1_seq2:93-1169(+)
MYPPGAGGMNRPPMTAGYPQAGAMPAGPAPGASAPGATADATRFQAAMQVMQAAAMRPQGGYAMYPPYPAASYPAGMQRPQAPFPSGTVPGGGAADGGWSAAYAAWAAAYGAPQFGAPAGPADPFPGGGAGASRPPGGKDGLKGKGGGKGKGPFAMKGKGKGKGKGPGKSSFFNQEGQDDSGDFPDSPSSGAGDPRRQIELAQRTAKARDRSAISQAQRSAQQRFEKDLLDRVQGRWVDESDPSILYVVEGNMCSVSSGENSRVFRNRISVFGGELCWDARRFWHYLNLNALPALGEPVERVEWKPGEGSPPTKPITWLPAPPAPVPEPGAELDDNPDNGDAPESAPADDEATGNLVA